MGTFHKTWEYLMPVIEKIEQSEFVDELTIKWDNVFKTQTCEILPALKDTFNTIRFDMACKRGATYFAAVEFARWHKQR